jgi:hypothetical protein
LLIKARGVLFYNKAEKNPLNLSLDNTSVGKPLMFFCALVFLYIGEKKA